MHEKTSWRYILLICIYVGLEQHNSKKIGPMFVSSCTVSCLYIPIPFIFKCIYYIVPVNSFDYYLKD